MSNSPSPLTRLTCRLLGHKWQTIWSGGPRNHGWPALVCLRCHENGWQVTE